MKSRGDKLSRVQVEHRSSAEKLEYILEFRFPDVAFELEELEDALAEGLSLTEAIDAVMDENEIPADQRAQFAADLQAARELKREAESSERLEALYLEVHEQERKRTEAANEQARLDREQSSFYNQPDAEAKFDEWVELPYWTNDEATALSFGKEPKAVNLSSLRKETSTFAVEYRRRFDLIRRSAKAGEIGKQNQVRPILLVSWAKRLGVKYAPEIETVVLADKTARKSAQTKGSQVEDVNAKNLSSLYRMVLGMAMFKYGFDHEYDPRIGSPAFANIVHDLGKIGIPITVKPVRKHILEALAHAKEQKGLKLKKAPEPRS